LRDQGVIKAWGLGVNEVEVLLDVMQHTHLDCILMAGRYSLLDRSAERDLLPLCRERGTSFIIGGVFNSGILATGVRSGAVPTFNYAPAARALVERAGAIEDVCAEFGVPLRAAALQFPLAHEAVAVVVAGARSAAEWSDCAAMMDHPIPAEFWLALKERGLLPPEAPTP
jgi:D-threo-aldose 1-dehydrogenase